MKKPINENNLSNFVKKKFAIFTALFLSLLAFQQIDPSLAQSSGEYNLVYEVISSNETNNLWFNSDYSASFNYNIEINSTIQVDIVNVSDPLSALDIIIGNLTRSNITDYEAEQSLAIGYWALPNMFGFMANTSWIDVETDFTDYTFNSSEFKKTEQDHLGASVSGYIISFSDAYQSTSLFYEEENGILLTASTNVFGFMLEFSILSINGDREYYKSLESSLPIQTLSVVLALLLIPLLKKKLYR